MQSCSVLTVGKGKKLRLCVIATFIAIYVATSQVTFVALLPGRLQNRIAGFFTNAAINGKPDSPKQSKRQVPRRAVVMNFGGRKNTSWIKSAMAVEEVGFESWPGGRLVSESGPWLQWIVRNYHSLDGIYAFLHGDLQSWHGAINVSRLLHTEPSTIEMLGECVFTGPPKTGGPGTDFLYNALFGMSFDSAFELWHMRYNYRCCSEHIVTAGTIKRHPLKLYQELLKTIWYVTGIGWGWAFEYTWQAFYTKPILPLDKVLESIRSFRQENEQVRTATMPRAWRSPCKNFTCPSAWNLISIKELVDNSRKLPESKRVGALK